MTEMRETGKGKKQQPAGKCLSIKPKETPPYKKKKKNPKCTEYKRKMAEFISQPRYTSAV